MTDIHQFNKGAKSWKIYAKELTTVSGDSLDISSSSDIILKGNEIIAKGDLIVDGNFLPLDNSEDVDLGSIDKPFRDLFISENSIHMGSNVILSVDPSNDHTFKIKKFRNNWNTISSDNITNRLSGIDRSGTNDNASRRQFLRNLVTHNISIKDIEDDIFEDDNLEVAQLIFKQPSTNYKLILAPDATMSENITFKLPITTGNNGQVLQTDGDGTLSWTNQSGGDAVTLSDTQTLRNKTLTSPTITGTGTIAGTFTGDLTGDVTGNCSGTAATVTGGAQTAITSVGKLTALQVDNLNVDGNTITASSGAVNITPAAGSAIVLDGTINVDAGVVTGATSITSSAFVGDLTGDVTGNTATATKIASITNSNIVQLAETQTLTNKTLTSPTITGTGTIAGTFTGSLTGDVTSTGTSTFRTVDITGGTITGITELAVTHGSLEQSIILNGTGNIIGGLETGFYVDPIREVRNINKLLYNSSTGEITYYPDLQEVEDSDDEEEEEELILIKSDDRLKFNEQDISNSLHLIRQLTPKKYDKSSVLNQELNTIQEAGLIAQDILLINDLSWSVSGGDYYDQSNNLIEESYRLAYNSIFTYNIAATKELDILVQQQISEIESLKSENAIMKTALNELLSEAGKQTI